MTSESTSQPKFPVGEKGFNPNNYLTGECNCPEPEVKDGETKCNKCHGTNPKILKSSEKKSKRISK